MSEGLIVIQKLGKRLEDLALLSAVLLAILGAVYGARIPDVDVFVGGAVGFVLVFASAFVCFTLISFLVRSLTFICETLDGLRRPQGSSESKTAWTTD